ncbi:uncharacterized protein LOC125051922 [Pieris napi]|uniref:uncharacterized protein LOC125051922 n=1 Tax=Pieris napi TaxID=78633 RepID=UPI001FB9DDC9|nr:uncharacterized protein LOC125051922 [Pieris napi]
MLPIKILYVFICLNYVVGQSTDFQNFNVIFAIDETLYEYMLRYVLPVKFMELDYTLLVYNSDSVKISKYTESHRHPLLLSYTKEVSMPTTLEEDTRDLLFVIDYSLNITNMSEYENSYLFVFSNYLNPVHTSTGLSKTLRKALKKHVQVSFFTYEYPMTDEVSAHDEISSTLTNATGGVFLPIDILDDSVIRYIMDELIHKRISVDTKIFHADYEPICVFGFTVDMQTEDYSIIVIGDGAELLSLINNRNESIEYTNITLSKSVVVGVFNASTGFNFAYVTCDGKCQVIIRASSKLRFTPGFSAEPPVPGSKISASPLTNNKSYLSIEVKKCYGNIDILSAEVYNQKNWSQSLKIHKMYDNLYSSDEPILFPKDLIGVRINGVINETDETFTSIYPRLISPFDKNDLEIITVNITIGDPLTLECAGIDGEWIFYSSRQSPALSLDTGIQYFKIKRATLEDAGLYMCRKNDTIITLYKVQVQVPPTINRVSKRLIVAVIGDPVVVMPCLATGSPEPNVTWSFNGSKECTECTTVNNSLVIHNVTADSAGIYTCKAQNSLGSAWEYYVLIVEGAPSQLYIRKTLVIIKDRKTNILCNITHSEEDTLRWYRDGHFLMNGKLTLYGRIQDSGVYTCRITKLTGIMDYTVNLTVCSPPQFLQPEPSIVFISTRTILRCHVIEFGETKFTWTKDGDKLNGNQPELFAAHPGSYICEVTSHCGRISRRFDVVIGGCILNVDSDFDGVKPFILNSKGNLLSPMYNTLNDAVYIEIGESVRFNCGSNISLYHDKVILSNNFVQGKCVNGSVFEIDKVLYDFKNLSCEGRLNKIVRNDEVKCGWNKTLQNINYHFGKTCVHLYEVCATRLETVYIRHRLNKAKANKISTLADTPKLFYKRQSLANKYNCDYNDSGYCFKSRQLLNARDVYPGQAFTATFSNYNIVPEWRQGWSNWEELEKRVRMIPNSLDKTAEVYVYNGVIHTSNLNANLKRTVTMKHNYTVTYTNRNNKQNIQLTPMFLFKAVHYFTERMGVAFIQLNIPNVTKEEAKKYVFCDDICKEIEWLGNGDWKNPKRGYIYCCSIREFNLLFGDVVQIKEASGILRKI